MSKEIREALHAIGITGSQVDIYISILKHPLVSVVELSKITGKNRQQIYNDAEKLIERGLLERTNKIKRKYLASTPSKILDLAKDNEIRAVETLEKISEVIPYLENIMGNYKTNISTKFYEGDMQITEAYQKELAVSKNTQVLSLVGEIEEVFEMFPEDYWEKWHRKFVKNGSNSRMIVNDTKTARKSSEYDLKYKRETRYIVGFKLKINIDVFGNNVLLVSFRDKFAIWIESEIVASSYRTMFETIWNIAKS
jgi:sugar-specific transcriptional regulator TrmB